MAEGGCLDYDQRELKATLEEVEVSERVRQVRDLFHERCSILYHDVLDAMQVDRDDHDGSQVSSPRSDMAMHALREDLVGRHTKLQEQASILVDRVPAMAQDVQYRMYMVDNSIQQFKHKETSANANEPSSGCIASLRGWLQEMEHSLDSVAAQNIDWDSINHMQLLLKDHKELEIRIQGEGGLLVSQSQKYLQREESEASKGKRRGLLLSSLERRWHGLWLRAIECSCWLEHRIQAIHTGLIGEDNCDFESEEPICKRLKLRAIGVEEAQVSDILPFDAEDYELRMDADSNGNKLNEPESGVVTDCDIDYTTHRLVNSQVNVKHDNGLPETVFQDVGYSSGENSIHEGLDMLASYGPGRGEDVLQENLTQSEVEQEPRSSGSSPSLERRHRIENSPYKDYYKMTPLDDCGLTDTDTPRPIDSKIPEDSLYVYTQDNVLDDNSILVQLDSESHDRSYHEVMSILDESIDGVPSGSHTGSLLSDELLNLPLFQTSWKSFGGHQKRSPRKIRGSKEEDRESCDASAELSDADHQERLLSIDDMALPTLTPLPPLYPTHHVTSTPIGSLTRTRRRRRERAGCLTCPPSYFSESALLNISAQSTLNESMTSSIMTSSWAAANRGPPVAVWDRMSESAHLTLPRKKLRVKRGCKIERSASDCGKLDVNMTQGHTKDNSLGLPDIKGDCRDGLTCDIGDNPPNPPHPSPIDCSPKGTVCSFQDLGAGEGLTDRMDATESETAEQSEAYEWDDYKPLSHNECGNVEPQLDDSCVTAFGDDYALYMDTPQSIAINRGVMRGSRDSSGSETDDLGDMLDGIRKKLQGYKKLIKMHKLTKQESERLRLDAKSNVDYLINLTGKANQNGTKIIVDDLLKEWRSLVHGIDYRAGTNTDLFSDRMENILTDLKMKDNLCRRQSSGHYETHKEVLQDIHMFNQLSNDFNEQRLEIKMLKECLRNNNRQDEDRFSADLKTLCRAFDDAVRQCDEKLEELKNINSGWERCGDTMTTLKMLLKNLDVKVDGLECFANNEQPSVHSSPFNIKTVFEELHICQDRLNSLDTVCNSLTASSQLPIHAKPETEKLAAQLNDLQQRFLHLPGALDICTCRDNEARQRSWSKTINRRRSKPLRKGASTQPSVIGRLGSMFGKCRRMIGRWWPMHLCLLILIGLAIIFMQPSSCETRNNWRWSWGPQLDYVRGPPPS